MIQHYDLVTLTQERDISHPLAGTGYNTFRMLPDGSKYWELRPGDSVTMFYVTHDDAAKVDDKYNVKFQNFYYERLVVGGVAIGYFDLMLKLHGADNSAVQHFFEDIPDDQLHHPELAARDGLEEILLGLYGPPAQVTPFAAVYFQ